MPAQQPKENSNRFRPLFEQADSAFNSEYKLDIEALKAASKQAVKTADEKTKVERDRVMSLFKGINFFRRRRNESIFDRLYFGDYLDGYVFMQSGAVRPDRKGAYQFH